MKCHMEGASRKWRPRGRVIAVIWVVVLAAAVVLAVILQDGDPSTDEGAGSALSPESSAGF